MSTASEIEHVNDGLNEIAIFEFPSGAIFVSNSPLDTHLDAQNQAFRLKESSLFRFSLFSVRMETRCYREAGHLRNDH